MNKDDLKLTYVLKIGYNVKKEGLYEFVFSKDPSSITADEQHDLGWDEVPASQNASPPTQKHVDMVLSLKSKKIDLKCLHEADDRKYEDGYYTIHCLAYEDVDSDNSDPIYDETGLMVFHFGMKASEVKAMFFNRDMILKEIDITESQTVEFDEEVEEAEEEEEDDA